MLLFVPGSKGHFAGTLTYSFGLSVRCSDGCCVLCIVYSYQEKILVGHLRRGCERPGSPTWKDLEELGLDKQVEVAGQNQSPMNRDGFALQRSLLE